MPTTKWVHGTGEEQRRRRLSNHTSDDLARAADAVVVRAGRLLETGEVRRAEAELRQALEACPGHAGCRAYLAICLAAGRRKFQTAERIATNLITADPYDCTAYYALGRVHLEGGRRESAFKLFAKAHRLSQGDRRLGAELRRLDPRRPPVLRFLSRDHGLNVFLGRLLARLGGRRGGR